MKYLMNLIWRVLGIGLCFALGPIALLQIALWSLIWLVLGINLFMHPNVLIGNPINFTAAALCFKQIKD